MRSHLAASGFGIVKNKGIYCWEAASGLGPIRIDGRGVRGDHQSTLAAFRRIVKRDVLDTNTVDGCNVYYWLMEQRNRVQYRDRAFSEPSHEYFHTNVFDKRTFQNQVKEYIIDKIPIYCFDTEHCMLAAPIRRLLDTRAQLQNAGLPNPIHDRFDPLLNLIEEIDPDPH